ncbi:hypothetical protein AAFF_G00340600 [Aldrovandia affinis]|uniref:Uncharacterized protein n=1 Tax=Aldrovandia affinis TaxID=143900 RepID=A0AAD7SLM8_9TELE|nr:hypothetical protein AAFF_G00340600 [Aldrovandia affinis]
MTFSCVGALINVADDVNTTESLKAQTRDLPGGNGAEQRGSHLKYSRKRRCLAEVSEEFHAIATWLPVGNSGFGIMGGGEGEHQEAVTMPAE